LIYSALLEISCPIPGLAQAAGLPEGSTFGQIILRLIDELAEARRGAQAAVGFKPLPLVSADSILAALAVEKIFCCSDCAGRLTEMTRRWGLAGIVQPLDPASEPEAAQAARKLDERMIQ
jgi:hypothetical protein